MTSPSVYLDYVWHTERDSPISQWYDASAANYDQARSNILSLVNNITSKGGTIDFMPDYNLIADENKWGQSQWGNSGGQNLFSYLDSLANVSVEPHAHENVALSNGTTPNYADVSYALQQEGVPDHGIIGGVDYPSGQIRNFIGGEQGNLNPGYTWSPTAVAGADQAGHGLGWSNSGIWTPDLNNLYAVDPNQSSMVSVGGHNNTPDQVAMMLHNNAYDSSQMNTADFFIGEGALQDPTQFSNKINNDFQALSSFSGDTQWMTMPDQLNTWQNQYGGQSSLVRYK